MSRRIRRGSDLETLHMDLGDGDWCDIKKRFVMRDRRAINEAIVDGKMSVRTEVGENGVKEQVMTMGQLSLGNANVAWLVRGIVRWGGPGFCVIDHDKPGTPSHAEVDDQTGPCRPEPLTPDSIDDLDDPTARLILAKLQELNPDATEGSANP